MAKNFFEKRPTLGVILGVKRKTGKWPCPKNLPKNVQFFFYFWKVHELGFNLWVWFWVIPEIFLALGPFEKWLKMAKNDPQNENGPL